MVDYIVASARVLCVWMLEHLIESLIEFGVRCKVGTHVGLPKRVPQRKRTLYRVSRTFRVY